MPLPDLLLRINVRIYVIHYLVVINYEKDLTGLQKKKLCEMFNTRLYQNQELAEIFSVSPSTVTLIVSEKDKWLSLDATSQTAKIKRNKVPKFPNLEKALELPNISPSEDLCALDTLVIYLDQNQTDYSNDTKSVLRNLRRGIDRQPVDFYLIEFDYV
ncbi:4215_t:CDS:2 [Paraglomus occultum]|uniref:4215_t:CDS:1 n=1 Tax=Paraglomus occultum TaxID=144539 RepID=A0A9N9AT56_9GLOM|nr:4215_t:CDS:2 [Paraglomus occultum]